MIYVRQALLEGVPKDRLIMLDLFAEVDSDSSSILIWPLAEQAAHLLAFLIGPC